MALPQEEEPAGAPDWVVTFGDMMSLLLTFFVLLFSMSEIKHEESEALLDAMRNQFGIGDPAVALIPGQTSHRDSAIARLASLGRAGRLIAIGSGDRVKAPAGDERRVRGIRPGDDTLQGGVVDFPESSGELTQEALREIEAAAAIVKGKPQKIEVRGHTSSKPLEPDSPYRNQWDLAYARAFQVKQELVRLGVRENRIRLSLAAENEPRHISPSEERRRQNARVEIYLLNELTTDLVGTAEERRQRYSTGGGAAP